MSALSVALKYIRMAQSQLGEPLTAPEKTPPFSSDPLVNLETAQALVVSEVDLLKRKRVS